MQFNYKTDILDTYKVNVSKSIQHYTSAKNCCSLKISIRLRWHTYFVTYLFKDILRYNTEGGILHQNLILWSVSVSFIKNYFVVQKGIHTLYYFILFFLFFFYFLWESGKSVLTATYTLQSLEFKVNKCLILVVNKLCLVKSTRRFTVLRKKMKMKKKLSFQIIKHRDKIFSRDVSYREEM